MSLANSVRTIYLSQNLPIETALKNEPITDESNEKNTEQLDKKSENGCSCRSVKGYIYGLLYTIFDCMSYIFIKKAPILNGFDHGVTRYVIQIVLMGFLVYKNDLKIIREKTITKILLIRGVAGSCALVFGYLSLQFIDVSDTQTLINTSVLMTALMGRIFLKEKINICHVISIILTFMGVIFILRPPFLFGIEESLEKSFHLNMTDTNQNSTHYVSHNTNSTFFNLIGVILTLSNAFMISIMQVSTRSLANSNVHHSLISLYPSFFGIAITIFGSLLTFLINWNIPKLYNLTLADGCYSVTAASFGITGLVFMNKALKYEDALKVALLRISTVLFSMIFQYFFLNIEVDFLGILGGVFIVFGTLLIVLIKMFGEDILESKKFYRLLAVEF